jgi:hypothetical protein
MKKIIALALIGLTIAAHNAFGQTGTMLNLIKYAEYFGFLNGVIDPDNDFIFKAPRVERTKEISNLAGKERIIDTPLELALFSYYATSRISVRPIQADTILPANNPKLADTKLGAAVFQEIQVLRFLGDTAAVNRHEAVLKWITDRKNATRQEIEAFYRDNIRALIAAVVDEEFGKAKIDDRTLIQIYADWERRSLVKDNSGKAVNGITLIKETLTNFFLNPTQANYENIRGIYARYKIAYYVMRNAYVATIRALNEKLSTNKLETEVTINNADTLAKIPTDLRFNIFKQEVERKLHPNVIKDGDLYMLTYKIISFKNASQDLINFVDWAYFFLYTNNDAKLELYKRGSAMSTREDIVYSFDFSEFISLLDGVSESFMSVKLNDKIIDGGALVTSKNHHITFKIMKQGTLIYEITVIRSYDWFELYHSKGKER